MVFTLVNLLLPGILHSQTTDIRPDFYDAEFFFAEEAYRDALFSYEKVFKAGNQENANINYRIGVCYLNLPGDKHKAVPYLEKAVKSVSLKWVEGNHKITDAPNDAWLYLGNAYRINNQLEKAIEAYNTYISLVSAKDPASAAYTHQQIEACKRAMEAMKNPVSLNKRNLGPGYNTGLNNFNPVISGDGNTLAFMSEQRFYEAVYVVQKVGNNWANPVNVTPQIQSDGNQYVTGLSYDGKKMYLTIVNESDADIMESDLVSKMWTKSRNLGKPINTKFFESHASPSPDGNTLYFTSNRKGTLGEMDIFYSEKDATGIWKEPVNIGGVINTPLNEDSPFMSSDGKTLFFSSQGHESIGGYDIFYSLKGEDGSWSKPVPLPYPLNTTDDDLFFAPVSDGPTGYMTRFDPDGLGSGDLYFIGIGPPDLAQEQDLAQNQEQKVSESAKPAEETKPVEPVKQAEEVKEIAEVIEKETVEPAKTEPAAKEPTPAISYYLKPVFFGFDSYALNENAIQKLTEVKKVMDAYPSLIIEVQGNTDALGPDGYNQALSEKRAKAVVDYLTGKGVSKERLLIKGNGLSKPVAINRNPDGTDSRDGRQLNRRVEFRILKEGSNLIFIEEVEVPKHLRIP